MSTKGPTTTAVEYAIDAAVLERFLAALFADTGLGDAAARTMAQALIDADLQGVSSHGVVHAPIYLQRLAQGTLSTADRPRIVSERGAVAVLDAGSMLGHVAADHAVGMAIARAGLHGVGVVSVRNSGHFGVAGRYAVTAARRDCVGIALCNATPLIAAPGGAERLVGTNPLAIALPTADPDPLVLDMAMSEVAFGRIRVAQRQGRPIPASWALAADGSSTTDPTQALAGLLLPMAGYKGFGLSLMIDLLCGLLADGPTGSDIPRLYEDLDRPFDCSSLFVAIDVAAFRDPGAFKADVAAYAARIRGSRTVEGAAPIAMPGDRRAERRRTSGGVVRVNSTTVEALRAFARQRNLPDLPGPS